MTPVEAPPALADALRARLEHAPAPLKLKEAAKGLPRPKKVSAAAAEQEVRQLLDEEVRLGRAFAYPSGKKGEVRFWSRDEMHLIRDKALELAAEPLPLAKLKALTAKAGPKSDTAFVETVIRELIGEGRLHEHAPAKGRSVRFGASPPPPAPPWWELPKHDKALASLVKASAKLLTAARGSIDELLHALRARLAPPAAPVAPVAERPPVVPHSLEALILKEAANAPVVSLAELRQEMPAEYRGRVFDETVLRLADQQRVIISQDDNPERFTEAQRAQFVTEGRFVFTTLAPWN